MPDQLTPTQRAAWIEAAGGADNTTLTEIAAEVMRANLSAAKVADAAPTWFRHTGAQCSCR